MATSTHVLSVVPRLIGAPSGGEIRVLSLMKALGSRYRFSLITFFEPGSEILQTARALELEGRWGITTHFVRRAPMSDSPTPWLMPDLARSFYDIGMVSALKRIVREQNVDLVHVEFTQMAQYARSMRHWAPVVATEHDSSLLSRSSSYVRPGAASGTVQWAAAVFYLRLWLGSCDRVIAVSEAEARRLGRIMPRSRIRVVPTGVDLAAFPFHGLEERRPGHVAFVGHYPHYPNEEAAVFLCRSVLPELRALVPEATVSLIGSRPTAAVDSLRSEAVKVTGTVPEVAPLLSKARLFLAPMRLGYGIKGKLLEAFACGTPVVATPQACEAMPGLSDGVHLLIGRGAEDLAQKAARLQRDDVLSARLARAARAYVEERFGWDRQARLMDAVYQEVLEARK